MRSVALEHAGKTYTFVNTGEMSWSPAGQSIQAPEDFLLSLDGLLNLAARRWLAEAPPHEVVLGVSVRPREGEEYPFRFARAVDGTMLCLARDDAVAEVDPALVERLLRLF